MEFRIVPSVVHVERGRKWNLDVGDGAAGVHFGEHCGLAHVGRQRALLEQQVSQDVFDVVRLIQTGRLATLELHAQQWVILQVVTNAWQIGDHLDAVRAQVIGGADTRQHQDLWEVHRAAAQHDAPFGARPRARTAAHVFDASSTAVLKDDARNVRAGKHREVCASSRGRQEGVGGAVTCAVLLVDLKAADPFLRGAVEVCVLRNARGFRCVDEGPYQGLRQRGSDTCHSPS